MIKVKRPLFIKTETSRVEEISLNLLFGVEKLESNDAFRKRTMEDQCLKDGQWKARCINSL